MSSSSVLGTLVVRIAAEMRQYKADMDTAASVSTDTAKKIERANADVAASHDKLIGSAGAMGAAVGLAAAAAAAGIGVMVKGAIDNADAVGKMAQKTGIATETLSAYQHAASLSDVSNETLAQGMKALSRNIAEGSEVLGRMGIATRDSQGNLRSLDAVMGDVADKFNGYKDGAGKAADAQLVFGRAGMEMIPMMNAGSAGLAAMRKEAEELGLVIDGQTAAAAEAFNDNITRLQAGTRGYAASLAAQLLPALNAVTESFIEGGKGSGFMSSAVDVLGAGLKGLISVGYGVAAVFEQVGTYFGGIAAAAAAMLRGDFAQVKTIFGDLSQDLSDKAAASGARINQVWSAIGEGAKQAGAVVDQVDAPGKLAKVGKAAKAAATEAERMAAAGEKLAASLLAQDSGLSGDFAQKWDQLGAAYKAGGISLEVLVQAQAALLAQQPGIKAAAEATAKAELAAAQARDKHIESLAGGLAKLEEDVARQREHNAQIGLGREALADLTAARLEDQAAMLEGQAIKAMDRHLDMAQYELLMSQARALRELAALKREGGAAQAAVDAAKDATKAWDKFAEQVNQSLSDALMDAFMAGKGFGQTFVNSIKSMFNSMVLRPVISAIVSPVAGVLTSALGLSGTANAATGGAGALGNMGSLAGLAGSAGAFGSGLASGLTAWGAEGSVMGLLGSGSSLFAGGLANGMGVLAGALGPVALGLAAVYALAQKLDHSGTPHTGGGAMYSAGGGLQTQGLANGWSGGGAYLTDFGGFKVTEDATKMAAGITQSVVGMLDSAASTFGQQAGYAAATAFADDSSSDGAWGALAIKLGDKMVAEWGQWANGPGGTTFSDGSAGSAEYLAKISGDVRTVLNGIDMPAWAKKVLNDLPDGATLQQLGEAVALINKTQAVFTNLGQAMAGFATIGDVGRGRLVDAAGGIDALAASASAYYQAMYTEDEKAAAVKRQYTEALQAVNLAVPTTIEAYRAQVAWHESIADTEPGAAKVLATLYAMGPAFASVNQPAAELADTVVDTVEEIATLGQELDLLRNPIRTIKDIAQSIFSLEKEGASLQVELLRTYGDSASLAAAAVLQRDIETAGMTAQEIALYDSNAARRAEIDTIVAGRQAIADGVASWESYFNQFGTEGEKQARAKTRVQAVLPADVDTVQEYKDYVWQLTEQFGVGSAEVKKATDVAGDFALAFPAVAEVISTAVTAVTDLTAYQANFYTESERAGIAMDSLRTTFNALGLEMPTTNAGFRALVDAQDLTTASGITTFNTLMDVQGAFAQLYPMVQSVATAATVLTTDLAAFHAGFFTAAEQATLSSDAMNASLTALGLTSLPTTNAEFRALALGIDTSTESGKALFNGLMGLAGAFAQLHPLVTTVTEVVQTLDGAIASLRASGASRTVEQIASNMLTLEDQIFQLQNAGNTPALRQRTLEGLSDVKDSLTGLSERDLQNWVWSLQDAAQAVQDTAAANQTAADEMQRAAESAAAAAQRIASEHDGLWRQWLTLNGDTAALRALDLAALDPSNRALQEQIWALQDQKTAADEATAAAESMKSAWASLTDSMLDEVRRIRGLMDESSGSGYASLAAQFATATAQTRAGDQAAAKLLPGLSQSMLTAYESSASTLVDLQRVRAITANSLETTASLVSGVVPNGYGTAVLAPADAGPGTPAAQAAAQTTELQALRTEVAALRAALEAVVINTGKSTRLAQKWDDVGIPVTNPPDGAPLSVA